MHGRQECLQGRDWLTDRIIDVAQKLLHKPHPYIGSLWSSTLGETLALAVQRGDFVQILNVANSHWITVSNIGFPPCPGF